MYGLTPGLISDNLPRTPPHSFRVLEMFARCLVSSGLVAFVELGLVPPLIIRLDSSKSVGSDCCHKLCLRLVSGSEVRHGQSY